MVYSPILPNGALSSLQILNMMKCFDALPDDEVDYWHTLTGILKSVWRDRLGRLADPDFADVPVSRLLSEDYARERVEDIRRSADTPGSGPPADFKEDTFHFSAADVEGNAASVTLSHGGGFGSCFIAPGTGLVLGHGMCRFDPRPGRPNSIAGRKRPLNNTCPLLVRLPDRDVAVGLPGGRRIISVAPQLVRRIVDLGVSGHDAAVSPRLHVLTDGPVELTENAPADLLEALGAMGHNVRSVRGIAGRAHCAEILHREKRVRAGGNGWAAGAG
jgi:gamma-glutamyltranspeptidase/glutathione hydrolase